MSAVAHDHARTKERAAFWSIVASASLTLGKLVAGLMSGSLALISEAGHALLDTGATIVTYFAVKAADKPADNEHHYGHGKIEAVAALAETGLLIVLSVYVTYEAIHRLMAGHAEVEASPLAFAVLLASIGVDFFRWRSLTRIARETRSDALAADAMHFSSDLVSSVLVLIGLGVAALGYPQGDALAAVGVAVFIAIAGYRLGRRTIDTLTDTAPAGVAERLRDIALATPGVVGVETVRVRPAGSQTFAEFEIGVARTAPLDRLSRIKDGLARAVSAEFPEISTTVTATPRMLDEETVLERVLLIAARRRTPVHHVTVQQLEDRLSVSLDVEVDARLSIGAAHGIASKLEAALREELGSETEVETHIEPLTVPNLRGADVDPDAVARVTESLARAAAHSAIISDVHNVRVRATERGLVINYHCRVEPSLDVATVHAAVDQLEQHARADIPNVARIVSHTEPLRQA
jgi:cation diffusion facilitator family transporter